MALASALAILGLLTPLVLPGQSAAGILGVEVVATGLSWPVSFAFSPDGRIFYSERLTGHVRAIPSGGGLPVDIANVSVVSGGEQGLVGLALDPAFPQASWIYVYHTAFDEGLGVPTNRVVRLSAESPAIPAETLLDAIPAATVHNGGILGFAPDGSLFVTTGDAANPAAAQDPASLSGKVLRILPDGTLPGDNPFPRSPVFTLGHRNVFGLAFRPDTGRPYVSENGPTQDDEVNRLEPGANYGWPEVTGTANDPRFQDPLVTYRDVIAPTGLAVYTALEVPAWDGDLLLGDWNRGILQRIDLVPPDDRVAGVEDLYAFGAGGILDVEIGPDGLVYVSTVDAIYRLRAGEKPPVDPTALGLAVGVVGAVAVAAAVILYVVTRTPRRR